MRISKEHGLNPTMEQHVCVIDNKPFDTGSILLLGVNQGKKADMHTITNTGICPECRKKLDDGMIAFVAIDESKSKMLSNGNIKTEEAYRTGEVMWMKRQLAEQMFNIQISDVPMMFIQPEVIKMIEDKIAKQTS